MITTLIAVLLASSTADFRPEWKPGETWQVAVTVNLVARPKTTEPIQLIPATSVYTYTVLGKQGGPPGAGRLSRAEQIRIRIDDAKDRPRWLLRFDRESRSLLAVEELLRPGNRLVTRSPFAGDAWMPDVHTLGLDVAIDFPQLPESGQDETRVVFPESGSAAIEFTQAVVFGVGQVQITMTRTDPVTATLHRTTLVWETGKPWPTSTQIELGGQVLLSAVLQ